MKRTLVIGSIALLVRATSATAVFVTPDGGGDGSSWSNPTTLGAAISAASAGETIRMKGGTYTLGGSISITRAVSIIGGHTGNANQRNLTATPTVIDLQESGRAFQVTDVEGVLFDGLEIRNGNVSANSWGGAITIEDSEATVRNCVFQNCVARDGGAIAAWETSSASTVVYLDTCEFTGNNANGGVRANQVFENIPASRGGAVYTDPGVTIHLTDSQFQANLSMGFGGGVYINKPEAGSLVRCRVVGNSALSEYYYVGTETLVVGVSGSGGGVEFVGDGTASQSQILVSDCSFSENKADENGGGLYTYAASVKIEDCVFERNEALFGGAFQLDFDSGVGSVVERCIFQGNTAGFGGAVDVLAENTRFVSCLFAGNLAKSVGTRYCYENPQPGAASGCCDTGLAGCGVPGGGVDLGFDGGRGGAIKTHPGVINHSFNSSFSVTFENCTIVDNSSEGYGGAVLNAGPVEQAEEGPGPIFINSVLWDNQGLSSGNAYYYQGEPEDQFAFSDIFNSYERFVTTENCNIESLAGGTSTSEPGKPSGYSYPWNGVFYTREYSTRNSHADALSSDPMFIDPAGADNTPHTLDDNYRLQGSSPCEDAGEDVDPETMDLAAKPRHNMPDIGAYEIQPPSTSTTIINDFDGDGASDIALFDNATNPNKPVWFISVFPKPAGVHTQQFGFAGTQPVPGDFDGDGRWDVAVFTNENGSQNIDWYVLKSDSKSLFTSEFGFIPNIPVHGDYDGDGVCDLGVYHPPSGMWYIYRSSDQQTINVQFGGSWADPVPGDYNGDGKWELAVYGRTSGTWYYRPLSGGSVVSKQYGWNGAAPVPGDYDGDGKCDYAVYDAQTSTWYLDRSSGAPDVVQQFGYSGVLPVTGDFNGDGVWDIVVYDSEIAQWYSLLSDTNGSFTVFDAFFFGVPGGVPIRGPGAAW